MFFQASYFFVNRRVIFALRNSSTAPTQRKKKSVRFSGVDTVRYTHSPSEYDRSYQQQLHPKKPRNKLRIDTQLALGDTAGPLFFTQLSTNYGRHCKPHQEQNILLASC
ncbi:hypothetical protein BJV82DRAFT_717264 [Fennellomyces sp. T-0311]|nr:hypothetical protein BJV82DRAFT_717264 [Fennellomyces sp. T-0311]